MGRVTKATTGKLEDEEEFWQRFNRLLPPGDQPASEEFWSFVYGNRAAITIHLTANVTEPVLMLMANSLQERETEVRKQLRALVAHANAEWTPLAETLTTAQQRAQERLWSYVKERHQAIEKHGTPNIIEPILYSMLLGLARNMVDIEDAQARVMAVAGPG